MRSTTRRGGPLTSEIFNEKFSITEDMIRSMSDGGPFGRGLPSASQLQNPKIAKIFRHLLRDGRVEKEEGNEDLLSCHRKGWIYAEEDRAGLQSYSFPSSLHEVALSWRLQPTNDLPLFPSILALSFEVISKFKPSQLHVPKRRVGAESTVAVPEAQYQDEFYRSVFAVTRGNVRISPEFSTALKARKAGRIDFFIPSVKWGIELTRDGDRLDEHASRFELEGAYGRWLLDGDMESHILLDFRTKSVQKKYPGVTFQCLITERANCSFFRYPLFISRCVSERLPRGICSGL